MPSNAKDTISINKQLTPIGFTEITVLGTYRLLNKQHPEAIGCSTFNSLRFRAVTIASSHETYICIIVQNMNLLLKVCVDYDDFDLLY